jgi:hypothetical protein
MGQQNVIKKQGDPNKPLKSIITMQLSSSKCKTDGEPLGPLRRSRHQNLNTTRTQAVGGVIR